MDDSKKTKKELVDELRMLRDRIARFEGLEARCRELENRVRAGEDALRILINATTDIAFLIDPDGNVVDANENTAAIFDTTIEELTGGNVFNFIPKGIAGLSREKTNEACVSKKSLRYEIVLKDKYYENNIYPVFHHDGRIQYLAVYIYDITERKRFETMLYQAQQKFRNIFENATEGIFQTSLTGRFISANPSLARIHGYASPDELINTIADMAKQLYVDSADRKRLVDILNSKGVVQHFEVQMYRKDGSLHWISINAQKVKDSDGNALYYEGTMQDITERKMAEEALAESEERYRTAIEHSNDGVAIILGDVNQYVNRQFVSMFEYETAGELIDKSITLVVHPDDRNMVYSINRRRQQGEPVPSRYEFKGVTRRGNVIFVEVSATTITFRGTSYYLVYFRDITARKHAEEALRLERNRFQMLSENAPFGIAVIADEGSYTYINPKFREVFGYDLIDIPNGKTWFKKAYPDRERRKSAIQAWRNDVKIKGTGERMPRSFSVTCKDGAEKMINFIPVRIPSGEYIVTVEDITERIKAHEALIKSHQGLDRLNRAKTKAVHHISHELKTPIAIIQGNVRVLRKKLRGDYSEATVEAILEALERNLKRLNNISKETDDIFKVTQELEADVITDELDRLWRRIEHFPEIPEEIRSHWNSLKSWFGKYLSGSMQSYQSIDLYTFVLPVVERARKKTADRGRNIEITVEGEYNLFIFLDPSIIREVLKSVLKNAIENTPDGSLIHVAVEQKADKNWIHVTDYGIGITEENQEYIFGGLFHTRETDLYASRRPYDFGAGGKGFELLLDRAYAQRFGFEIVMTSRRCTYIPTDQDLCPGNIAQCSHITSREGCLASGGTTFSIGFPRGMNSAAN